MKRIWEIINEEKGKIKRDKGIHSIRVDKKLIMNQNKITNVLTSIFSLQPIQLLQIIYIYIYIYIVKCSAPQGLIFGPLFFILF
jgi:hypothetical protein